MRVVTSDDWREYDASVAGFLDRDPVGNTVALTVLDMLRHGGGYGDDPPWFAWALDGAGEVRGVAFRTPPYAVGLPPADAETARALGEACRTRDLPGANGSEPAVRAFAAGAGRDLEVHMTETQYALHDLVPPPPVAGEPRAFTDDDTGTYAEWMRGFFTEPTSNGVYVRLGFEPVGTVVDTVFSA
jgi:hypothetical protein